MASSLPLGGWFWLGVRRIGVVALSVVVGPAPYDVALSVVVLGIVAGDAWGLVPLGHGAPPFGARSAEITCCGEHARPLWWLSVTRLTPPLSAC
jgi:hypothetical protein